MTVRNSVREIHFLQGIAMLKNRIPDRIFGFWIGGTKGGEVFVSLRVQLLTETVCN